tara:strand:- start:130 stop:462 length:333 start_codon:yes stop_codon:yes gene_type:complete
MLQKGLVWGSLAVAVIATFAPDAFAYYATVLVALGLIWGFTSPIGDVSTRIAYYVLAAVLPGIANNLDAIPAIGGYANGILDNLAVVIAGIAIANVCVVLYNTLMAAGND